ncbi:39S ribosomal protein L43, mitochondrial-like [Mizuhopecten yessoensis]|uniref:Large ribosomal subunit protein mL43 n=1 Tax=Mizuhopecten yessoensis TaxID=6573 RepID=A0A210QLH8_MIZYE|nr:39S ribosomal protein L43, mitochondrial-like [Mizuhopecten yessoensis]OWF49521.1 39S ribosomal protein L43, mitochondrial [Mizuhopecten yessoensis]
MSSRSMPSTFVKNAMQNGLGRYVSQLQRITLNFCKSHSDSLGMRNFVEHHLMDFSKMNPGVVVYVKPRRHRPPRIVATFLNGNTQTFNVSSLPKEDICKWVEAMRTRSGVEVMRIRKTWHTDTPSIQGPWHPFLFKDPVNNTTSFPEPSLYSVQAGESASDRLLQRAEKLRQEQTAVASDITPEQEQITVGSGS